MSEAILIFERGESGRLLVETADAWGLGFRAAILKPSGRRSTPPTSAKAVETKNNRYAFLQATPPYLVHIRFAENPYCIYIYILYLIGR